jgi:integrase
MSANWLDAMTRSRASITARRSWKSFATKRTGRIPEFCCGCATLPYRSPCRTSPGIKPIDIAELMGHRDVKTTLTVYAHLINTDDHAGNMAALGALATSNTKADNVILLHGYSTWWSLQVV